jgi:CubicO group peptidase (beta-lactamase class C family)
MTLDPISFAASLDTYLTTITSFGFSGGALLAHKDVILLEKGYGLADQENRIPNSVETIFSLGSVTKPFTATAVMVLSQMDMLDVQDRVGDILDDVPEDKGDITIHHLLTHTAGLINYTGEDYEPAGKEQFFEKLFNAPLLFEPGDQYDYSNASYSLLVAVVEHISGGPFEEFLHKQLLKPAGMEQTGYVRPDWSGKTIARWYTGSQDNGHALEKQYPYWNLIGNGEMFSTLGDMNRWHKSLLTDDVLDAETMQRMNTPYLNNYAYGWKVDESEFGRLVHHNGASDLGTSALYRHYLDADLVLVMFFNQSYGDIPMVVPLQGKIDTLIAGEEMQLPPENVQISDAEDIRAYEGKYTLRGGGGIRASAVWQTLMLTAEGQDAINMLAFPGSSSDTHQALNQLHQDVFHAILEGDMEPLGDFLANADQRLDSVKMMLRTNLEEAKSFFGEIVGLQVAGTVPSSFVNGALDTIVALEFESGRAAILSITQNGKNIGLTILEMTQGWSLPSVPFRGGLLGYHIPLGLVVRLVAERDDHGSVVALETETGERAAIQQISAY